jgi:chromosome segregation ATPase
MNDAPEMIGIRLDDMTLERKVIDRNNEILRLREEIERLNGMWSDSMVSREEIRAEREEFRAEVERLKREMRRYLPVLDALEASHSAWQWYTDGTGIATLNGYRAALKEQK